MPSLSSGTERQLQTARVRVYDGCGFHQRCRVRHGQPRRGGKPAVVAADDGMDHRFCARPGRRENQGPLISLTPVPSVRAPHCR